MSFRYACYSCPFAQINRIGDFTIGDCDSRREYPGFHLNESTSIILINNKKAQDIWNGGANKYFEYIPLDIEREQQCNKQLSIPSSKPVDRDSILKKFFNVKIGLFKICSTAKYHGLL